MYKVRMRFAKTGRAKYISHLDLMRTFQRALTRSGLPVRHTEGFNPHVYLSVALPLQLGCESLCEILDIECMEEVPFQAVPEKLNPCLPEGLEVVGAAPPEKKPSAIRFAQCRISMEYDDGLPEGLAEKLLAFFQQAAIPFIKKNKRGEAELNLAEHMQAPEISRNGDDGVSLTAIISAQNPTINPANLMQALEANQPGLSPSFFSCARIEIYDADMRIFQ